MSELSDHLGIPHFSTAKGSTVRSDFLQAVGARLGIPIHLYKRSKDELLLEIVRVATMTEPDPKVVLSRGGTVKNNTLQMILDGIRVNHRLGPVDRARQGQLFMTDDGPVVVAAPADPYRPEGAPELPTGQDALDMPEKELQDLLDPGHRLDPDDRRLLAVAYREGQDGFRTAVIDAYRQDLHPACCVTGHGPVQVLEAAHIVSHAEGGVMTVDNGLCLRSDIHRLFDRRLMAVHENTLTVLIHPVLESVPAYAALAGQKIHVPVKVADRPARAALKHRREAAGL